MKRTLRNVSLFASFAAASLVLASPTAAAVIETDSFQNGVPYAVSGPGREANLNLAGVASSGLLNGQEGTSTNVALLSDGHNLSGVFTADNSNVVAVSDNGTITYTFGSPTTVLGISTYSEWRDAGRSNQDYTVATSTDGINFTPLHTVNYDSQSGANPNVAVTLTGFNLTGVEAVQFQFGHVQNDYVGYTELAVFTTPEPTSFILGGLGVVGLLVAARRRRKA